MKQQHQKSCLYSYCSFPAVVDAELRIKVPATLDIDRKGGKSKRSYVISATVKGGRITQVNWNQI